MRADRKQGGLRARGFGRYGVRCSVPDSLSCKKRLLKLSNDGGPGHCEAVHIHQRNYVGWAAADFSRFQKMMLTEFYAGNHQGLQISLLMMRRSIISSVVQAIAA